jgi:hypothetical protein
MRNDSVVAEASSEAAVESAVITAAPTPTSTPITPWRIGGAIIKYGRRSVDVISIGRRPIIVINGRGRIVGSRGRRRICRRRWGHIHARFSRAD